MRQHYDAAYRYQSSGDLARADLEHAFFLVAALRHIANFNANTGDYAHAVPLYDEAIALSPSDFALLMDYAGASLDATRCVHSQPLLVLYHAISQILVLIAAGSSLFGNE
jgi:hypothetical protein